MARLIAAVYLLAMLVAGWRLHGLGWSGRLKGAAAVGLVLPIPLLMLLPALIHPERPFADMLLAIGLALLLCGLLCLMGGWSAARLRARRTGR